MLTIKGYSLLKSSLQSEELVKIKETLTMKPRINFDMGINNDKPIILTTKVEKETYFKNYLLKTVKLASVIRKLNNTKLQEVRLIHKKEKKLLKKELESQNKIKIQLLILEKKTL